MTPLRRLLVILSLGASAVGQRSLGSWIDEAHAAQASGQTSEAQALLQKAWFVAGDAPATQREFLRLLLERRFFKEAAKTAEVYLARHPTDPLAHGVRGASLAELNDHPGAVSHLERATEGAPKDARWWALLARSRLYLGRDPACRAALEKASALAPADPFVLHVVAECAYRRMDLMACERAARQILTVTPKDPRALDFLVRSLRMRQQRAEARRVAEAALESGVQHGELHLELGLLSLEEGNAKDAVASLETAARLLPRDPRPHGHLAKAWRRLGDSEKAGRARAAWNRLSKLDAQR